tara:strand:+ start:274 stop:447 length:174 start_codon:yes stop_codon:yes gene_type:complete
MAAFLQAFGSLSVAMQGYLLFVTLIVGVVVSTTIYAGIYFTRKLMVSASLLLRGKFE